MTLRSVPLTIPEQIADIYQKLRQRKPSPDVITGPLQVELEGAGVGPAQILNFLQGANIVITASGDGTKVDITISGSGGGSHDHMGTGVNSTVVSGLADANLPDAAGDSAFAGGDDAFAHGDHSVAIGRDALVSIGGTDGVAIGYASEVYPSIIEGTSLGTASGVQSNYGIAIGPGATVYDTSNYGIAIGWNAGAGNAAEGAIAIGQSSNSYGQSAIAIGSDDGGDGGALASGFADIVLGVGATTVSGGGENVIAGYLAQSKGYAAIVIGESALADTGSNEAIAIGYSAYASGSVGAVAVGESSRATADYSTAVGISAGATAKGATSIGANNTTAAAGKGAVVVGYGTPHAAGNGAIALGSQRTNNTGFGATASGAAAVAIGGADDSITGSTYPARATGRRAIAVGGSTHPSVDEAGAYASGDESIAIGALTTAAHAAAVALGYKAATTNANQIMLGTGAERMYSGVPNSVVTDADIPTSMITIYLDETLNTLHFRVRYSDGATLKSATLALV